MYFTITKEIKRKRKECVCKFVNKNLSATVATAVNKFIGTSDFKVVHGRVIGSFEPLEAPAASFLELTRQLAALGLAANSTVTISPSVSRCSPLISAAVEESYSTSRNQDVELTSTQITSSVAYLFKSNLRSFYLNTEECKSIIYHNDHFLSVAGEAR